MKKNSVSSTVFGNLIYGNAIDKNILGRKSARKINLELQRITKNIKDEKLDSLNNVDIILEHKKSAGFYGIISSKKEGIPMHPDYACKISDSKISTNKFKEWALSWNDAYAPESMSIFEKAFNMIGNDAV